MIAKHRIALIWNSFGPYHYDRLQALKSVENRWNSEVLGIEIVSRDAIYGWKKRNDYHLQTLYEDKGKYNIFSFILKLYAILSDSKIDTIFLMSYYPLESIIVGVFSKMFGLKVVMMFDSTKTTERFRSGIKRKLKTVLVSMYDGVFVSGSMSEELIEDLVGRKSRILKGYDCVNNDKYKLKLPTKRNRSYLLYVGRLVEKKNVVGLVRAYSSMVAESFLPLVIVGCGEEYDSIVSECKYCNLEIVKESSFKNIGYKKKCIVFLGKQVESLVEIYNNAAFLIIPSYKDEWGLVVNEGMAASNPILISNRCGSFPELLVDKRNDGVSLEICNGVGFDPYDEMGFVNSLCFMMESSADWDQMGLNSEKIISRYSLGNFANSFFKLSGC